MSSSGNTTTTITVPPAIRRRRGDGGNAELEMIGSREPDTVRPAEAPYDGSVVCLMACVLALAVVAVVMGLLIYWRLDHIENKFNMIFPNASEVLAERETLHMQTMRDAVQAFRKRQAAIASEP
jgi:hypothetical protein